jgi:hypothetical protein
VSMVDSDKNDVGPITPHNFSRCEKSCILSITLYRYVKSDTSGSLGLTTVPTLVYIANCIF